VTGTAKVSGHGVHLNGLDLLGVGASESATLACTACGDAGFQLRRTRRSEILAARPSLPLLLTRATRVVIGVTAQGLVGRWIVDGFGRSRHLLTILREGCMPPRTTALSNADAADPSLIPSAACVPAALSPPNEECVFWAGPLGRLWKTSWLYGHWGVPAALPASTVQSRPAVAMHANGQQDVFWSSRQGELTEEFYNGVWASPIRFASATGLTGPPAAGIGPHGNEYVFWRGTGRHLFEMTYTNHAWNTPFQLAPSALNSGPAVVVHPNGQQDVFWRGTNGRLWEYYDSKSGAWTGPFDFPQTVSMGSAPSAALDAAGDEYVVWRGGDGHLYMFAYHNHSWAFAPTRIPTGSHTTTPGPAVGVHADGEQDVFWRDRGGKLWESYYTTQWNGPISLSRSERLATAPGVGVVP
jgi:hypothetical protein